MIAIVVTDQAAGTAGMKLVERPEPQAALGSGEGSTMELNQIRYFLNLADTLNFTEAAMRSGVSQPTLTRAIQRLEQELGGTLVYRDGKDSRLTALGREIRSEFAAIADSEQRVRAISLNRVRGRRENLTLGVVNTIAPALITGFVTHALRPLL